MRVASIWLFAVVSLASLATAASSVQDAQRDVLRGACYCQAADHLNCLGVLSERECNNRCAEELCDDWYWLERRPCWNWGYGG
jgi:hypothetical protein